MRSELAKTVVCPRFPRKLPKTDVMSQAVQKRIRELRDAIEHTKSRIPKEGKIEGELLMLAAKSDGMELDGIEVSCSELVGWLSELNQLAEFVATYRENQAAL